MGRDQVETAGFGVTLPGAREGPGQQGGDPGALSWDRIPLSLRTARPASTWETSRGRTSVVPGRLRVKPVMGTLGPRTHHTPPGSCCSFQGDVSRSLTLLTRWRVVAVLLPRSPLRGACGSRGQPCRLPSLVFPPSQRPCPSPGPCVLQGPCWGRQASHWLNWVSDERCLKREASSRGLGRRRPRARWWRPGGDAVAAGT